jgi:tRNA-specific 2-thiouridylase
VSDRWLVAMSGGVDSSVAAALMMQQGHEVIGVTMDLGSVSDPEGADADSLSGCCAAPQLEDAREVARCLGIRHYTVNYRREFRELVIQPFVQAYLSGETPVPCIACNRLLKFDLLMRRAAALGATGVCTGHYALVAPGPDDAPALFRARDRGRDQSFFLSQVPREALARIAFPLAQLSKDQVRERARALSLGNSEKPGSRDICFIPDGDVRSALALVSPGLCPRPGAILDRRGEKLGEHDGAIGYTVGQRHGLGLGGGPWYVVEVRPGANELVVDRREALLRDEFEVSDLVWADEDSRTEELRVQVRSRHRSLPARVERLSEDRAKIICGAPAWAPAPGQTAVLYDAADERVVGGGRIR